MNENKPDCKHAILVCATTNCSTICRTYDGKGCFEPMYECGADPDRHPCSNQLPRCYIAALEETVQKYKDKVDEYENLVDLYKAKMKKAEEDLEEADIQLGTVSAKVCEELIPSIGDVIEWKGKQYRVVEDGYYGCSNCPLEDDLHCMYWIDGHRHIHLVCGAECRPDHKGIILEEIKENENGN